MLNIGIIGFGNVGHGIFSIFEQNGSMISQRLDQQICIKKIAVRNIEKYRHLVSDESLLTTQVDDILDDPNINIVIEVIGGEYPAFDYITKALKKKKYVVTANKEVISKHKQHFFKLARDNGVDIYFEAAVGGGIPIIRSLKVGFAANKINAFYGIVNGTTNYILTKIKEEKKDFDVILRTAQDLGFAEADPSMDISGQDAAYKCSILAAVAFKIDVQISDISYTGIESISLRDIEYAQELGYAIRLIAIGKSAPNNAFQLHVSPIFIPLSHPLANVYNEYNAVYIVGNHVGDSMLMGKGAGASPTASAVVSDVMDIAFGFSHRVSPRNLETRFTPASVLPLSKVMSHFFIRLKAKNKPGALEEITLQFSSFSISIENIIQKESNESTAEVVIVTNTITRETCDSLCNALETIESCESIISKMPLYKEL